MYPSFHHFRARSGINRFLPDHVSQAYSTIVGRKALADNFTDKFEALGTFLTGENKSTPEANKTQARLKLSKANNSGR